MITSINATNAIVVVSSAWLIFLNYSLLVEFIEFNGMCMQIKLEKIQNLIFIGSKEF